MVPNWWKVHSACSGNRYSLQVDEMKTAPTVDHPPIRRHGIIQLVLIIMPTFTGKLGWCPGHAGDCLLGGRGSA
jgi:hypothetical protein